MSKFEWYLLGVSRDPMPVTQEPWFYSLFLPSWAGTIGPPPSKCVIIFNALASDCHTILPFLDWCLIVSSLCYCCESEKPPRRHSNKRRGRATRWAVPSFFKCFVFTTWQLVKWKPKKDFERHRLASADMFPRPRLGQPDVNETSLHSPTLSNNMLPPWWASWRMLFVKS